MRAIPIALQARLRVEQATRSETSWSVNFLGHDRIPGPGEGESVLYSTEEKPPPTKGRKNDCVGVWGCASIRLRIAVPTVVSEAQVWTVIPAAHHCAEAVRRTSTINDPEALFSLDGSHPGRK